MPKMKTKSSARKRFKVSATGKVFVGVASKRHNMRKRPNRMLRGVSSTWAGRRARGHVRARGIRASILPQRDARPRRGRRRIGAASSVRFSALRARSA